MITNFNYFNVSGSKRSNASRERYPEKYVLVLTIYDDDKWVFDAIRVEASGYLLKDTPHRELIKAIHGTVNGQSLIDPLVGRNISLAFPASAKSKPKTLTKT